MKVSTLLCVSSILHSFVDGNELACITNVTGGTDYFPDKVKPVESKFWSVTYWNTYKIVANTKVGETYLLYQCGTQPPASQLNGSHAAVLSVPLPEVNVLYTTMIPFLEILGERERIAAYLGNMAYVASPCVNKLYDEGKIKEVLNPYNATSIKNIPLNITSFVGTADNTAFETQIRVSDDDEDTNLGTYEWIKFYSLFFNKEQTANEVFSATKARYTCAEENAGLLSCGDEKKPVVLWASYSAYCGGWDVAICPNYYCEFAAACNAKLLSSKTQGSIYSALCFRNYMTTEEFVAFGKDADVWIYTSPGFDTTLANFTGDLANFTSVLNKQVFDTQGSGSDAWFEERLAEPGTLSYEDSWNG